MFPLRVAKGISEITTSHVITEESSHSSGTTCHSCCEKQALSNQRLLFELKEIANSLKVIQNMILSEKVASKHEVISPSEMSVANELPAKTKEQLIEINTRLMDDHNFSELVMTNIYFHMQVICSLFLQTNVFSLCGGSDAQKTVYFIMNKIFDKDLAPFYSGQGKKKKFAFNELERLYISVFGNNYLACFMLLMETKIFSAATRKRHTNVTEEDVKKCIGLFLATAKSRLPKNTQDNLERE